jgi:hypothetical protein
MEEGISKQLAKVRGCMKMATSKAHGKCFRLVLVERIFKNF